MPLDRRGRSRCGDELCGAWRFDEQSAAPLLHPRIDDRRNTGQKKSISAGCSSKRTASAYHRQQTATANVKRNNVSRLLAARSRNNTNAAKSASPAPTKTTNEPAIEPTTIVCAGPNRLNA